MVKRPPKPGERLQRREPKRDSVDSPFLSIVVPVYNEEDNVGILYDEIRKSIDPLNRPFEVIFVDMGQSLPLITEMVMGFSQMIIDYWWAILGILGVGFFSFHKYIQTPRGRWNWDRLKLRMPILGFLIQKIEIARFTRTLGTLTQSGVPILQAMNIVKDIVGNTVIAKAITNAQSSIKEGEKISDPLRQSRVFPPLAVHMIDVGEETGQLENMMFKVADTYEAEVRTSVKRLVGLLEPVLILIMGGFVALIVIAMLLAIFSINEIPF